MATGGAVAANGGGTADAAKRATCRAPLRSADWRFLVPDALPGGFGHVVVVGADAGVAKRLESLNVAARVSQELPVDGAADVVIAASGTLISIDRLAAAVAPDGVLYLEIERRARGWRASGPTTVCRALRRGGLSVTAMYAVAPDFIHPWAFVSLDDAAAYRWYGRTLFNASTFTQWASEELRRIVIGGLGRRTASLLRRYVVIAVGRARHSTVPSVLAAPEVTRLLGVRGESTQPHAIVMLAHGGDRVVLLPFARGGRQPMAVVKIAKVPEFNARTENEQVRMKELRGRLHPELAAGIPTPRGVVRCGSTSVAVESWLSGRSLARSHSGRRMPLRRKIADLALATDWLIRFHRESLVQRVSWTEDLHRTLVDNPVHAYVAAFGTTAEESRLLELMRARSAAINGAPFVIVWQHRDYSVWNLARHGERLAVLDWEGTRPGPALCDALHLVTSWLQVVRRPRQQAGELETVRELFVAGVRSTPAADAARAALARYMSALAIDQRVLPVLLVYHRIELALRRLDQRRVQGEQAADHRAGNLEVLVLGLLARYAEQVFAEGEHPV